MPFTLSHAAAALPLRRLRLIPSALVIGTFAPDLEYFLRLAPGGGWGHTVPGAFGLSLPLGLATLWVYHRFIKSPAIRLLPGSIQQRIPPSIEFFQLGGIKRFLLIIASLLIGIATHICWDSFTHSGTWLFAHWAFLHRNVSFLRFRFVPVFELLQYISTVVGFIALLVWFADWYTTAKIHPASKRTLLTPAQRWTIILIMGCVGTLAAVVRAYLGTGIPDDHQSELQFGGQLIVTVIAALWWQLLIWGMFFRSRAFKVLFASEQPYTQARS